ncbi:MAG: AAA family ATPase [Paludibacter sp.]|nr:AAA family ATPase [Paludibacter sp.]
MKIKSIKIENYRGIKDISIELMDNLNVFVGINGSGKTTILDAISISLSWLVNRIQRQGAAGKNILDADIRNNTAFSAIEISVKEREAEYDWKLYKAAKGTNALEKSELNEVSELASKYQESLVKESRLPIIAYYPVARVVDRTMPEIRGKENLYILDVYDNALGGKINYQSFFEWFRLQDDIVNEEAVSRTKWMQQNKGWIQRRVKGLLDLMNEITTNGENKLDRNEYAYLIRRFEKDEMIYEEPRFLFHELSNLIERVGIHSSAHFKYEKIFHELEYMFHKMEMFSREYSDDLIDEGGRYGEVIDRIIKNFRNGFQEKEIDKNVMQFTWEAFILANILSLWWMSDKAKRDMERELRKYSLVIKQINQTFDPQTDELSTTLTQIIRREIQQKKNAFSSEGQELKAVIKAIEQFVPEYSSLRVTRVPRPIMLINKNGETFNIDQLSDGEKNLITLVGDIARRLAIANPTSNHPLHGEGIILIDEIDLHLHPSWQRLIISQLTKVFPNCQFIITTHSPQVISQVQSESLFLLKNKNNELSYSKALESYGMNTDRILEDLLDVDARPSKEKKELHKIFQLIQENKIEEAKSKIITLKNLIGEDPELVKASVLIKRKEIIGK